MRTIKKPHEKVYAFICTDHPESDSGWRLSLWAVPFEKDGVYLMKHTFSGETVRLTAEEFAAPEGVEELRKKRFVVPADYDEAEKYTETMGLIRLTQPDKPGLKTYTIFPTTGCNARCVYCYEEGFAVKTMTRETAERLVDFICETRHDDKITLAWFGGEPLVGADTISYICRSLEKRGVPFRSRMVTNAALMTPELIKEAKELWKLERVQVSLDGDRRDYNERKRYIDPVRHNYDTVIRAIHLLADADIKVSLRVNLDGESIVRLRGFLEEMKEEFGDYRNVTLYLSALYQEHSKPLYISLEKEILELDRLIRELGLNYKDTGTEGDRSSFRLNSCMADRLDKSIVIDPEGRFHDCEHLPEGHSWGNIFDGVTDSGLFDRLSAVHPVDDMCRKCPFLPMCTPFRRHGCPGWYGTCREVTALRTEYELNELAEAERRNDI